MEVDEMKPRAYQSQLEEIAVSRNTIIHLPTGSGKTFIATQLIKRFRTQLQKPWGEGGKRTFFLVNTVPLVVQQKNVIDRLCAVNGVGGYSSEDNVDYWNKDKWDEELTKNQVVVMTCQILKDMLTHSYIKLEDINLIIFDECHHAVNEHPMREVMKHFQTCPSSKQPRVLGLTATLLNANVSIGKIEATLREIENTFHATIATVNELGEVLNYSTNPRETVQYYNAPVLTDAAKIAIQKLNELQELIMSVTLPKVNNPGIVIKSYQQDITRDPQKVPKGVKNMVVLMTQSIMELGVYGGALTILAYNILLQRLQVNATSEEERLLYQFTFSHAHEARMILLQSMRNETGYDKIIKHSSEKVILMLKILKEYSPKAFNAPGVLLKLNNTRKPLCAIIFAKQRFTVKVLYNLLKDIKEANPEEYGFLNHEFIVGFNINPYNDTREQYFIKKSSQKAFLKFKNGELNCLMSTSVIEEGVDIPQCLLVIRFDAPVEYRSYIQSKGRARSAESNYVILVNAAERQRFLKQYQVYQDTERYIQNMLVGNSDDRDAPTEDDIQESLYDDDCIPPYVTAHGGRLSSVAAISLLNRYCSMLPHDQFTLISPVWLQEKVNNRNKVQQVVTVILPLGCPLKDEIRGYPMDTAKDAKRSAALNACIKLHQAGVLDEITLLPHRYASVDFDNTDVKSCFLNWPWEGRADENTGKDIPKPGTKKRCRKHYLQFPSYLESVPGNNKYYLHLIHMKTAFQPPTVSREKALYNFLLQKDGFGFLTSKPLPKLCEFPIFTTIGEVKTAIEVNYATLTLNESLIELLKKFHRFVFQQVLGVAKNFLVFEGKVNCLFLVPLKYDNGYDLDWDIVKNHKPIGDVVEPSAEEKRSLRVTKESYINSVVTPWYRGILPPDRYIVSNVLEYLTPQSHFDTNSYETYIQYYSSKHNLEIVGPKDQPMLEVRNISTRMNCLLPRAATIKSFTEKQKKLVSESQGDDKPKQFTELFVPEFCIKYDFPGILWYKATMIPSIVHRVYMLLVAHDLITEIAKYTRYGQPVLTKNETWLPIEGNLHIATKSLLSNIEENTPVGAVDRINDLTYDSAATHPKKATMKESLYQLQTKKIDEEYPWDSRMEPIDIERNLNTVTLMDIECYDKFVSAPFQEKQHISQPRSPPFRNIKTLAIAPTPSLSVSKLAILQKKPHGRGPELRDVVAALTTINSHDTFNLERAETLGDSFLKFAATLYLYHKFPQLNEGQLTNVKCRLISNRNLYYAGEKINLGGRMKVEQFSPRKDFLVPGFFAPKKVEDLINENKFRSTFLIGLINVELTPDEVMSGQLSKRSWQKIKDINDDGGISEYEPEGQAQNSMQCYIHSQAVADKSVADCVEALVGTYLLSGGILAAVKLLEYLKVFPPEDNFVQYLHKRQSTAITENKVTEEQINFLLNGCRPDIEKRLNYKFKDPSLLLEALSHPSYIRNRTTKSYERLEFLGDAILDFLVTTQIFEKCGELKPGELTELRSALVNNVTFASFVVKLELHKFICSNLNPVLFNVIKTFVDHQVERGHKIEEDILTLIDEEDCQIAEYVEVPKVLSDIFESLAGAIYLDSGGDLDTVWSIYYGIMHQEIDMFSARIPQNPVKTLYENIHACPKFGKSTTPGPDSPKCMIPVTFTKKEGQATIYGMGSNKAQAKRAAAKLALKLLNLV